MFAELIRKFSLLARKAKYGEDSTLPNIPTKLNREEIDFITRMVNDELDELKQAKDIGEQADALADAIYYLYDCAGKAGINLDKVLKIVHENNMSKIKGKKTEFAQDGKVEKPVGWVDPKETIAKEINRQIEKKSFRD